MKTYFIGRGKQADIMIPDADNSVAGIHLELVEEAKNQYYILDCDSLNGTFRKQGGRWLPIQKAYIHLDEPLLLGKYQTTIRQLLALRVTKTAQQQKMHIGVQRDPETGEIVPRRY